MIQVETQSVLPLRLILLNIYLLKSVPGSTHNIYGKLDSYISMQDIFMTSFSTLLWVSCHVSPGWYIWLYCGGCLHECYWWFKQLGSEAFLITPAEEKVIIVDNTIIYHTILQTVPIRKEPLSSFSRCYLSATNTSLFSVLLCVNIN